MNDIGSTTRTGSAVFGFLLAIGLIGAGWSLGSQIKATRLGDRYMTVKGLVERRVKSDLVIWPISYKEAGDDLSSLYAKTELDKKTITTFLSEQGIQPSEIELGIVRVVDTQANEYGGNRAPFRYIVQQQITVRSTRVDQVSAAAQKTMQLLQKGVVLGGDQNSNQGLIFKFNGLNAIKPDMITEGTRNAHDAADRFAADSGSKVGSIRQANQGIFSILPADQAAESTEEGGGGSADSSLMKVVRVVTTVEYYLGK